MAETAEHRLGAVENDYDTEGAYTGWQRYRCPCGWTVRFRPMGQIIEAKNLALDHVVGILPAVAVTGFRPQPIDLPEWPEPGVIFPWGLLPADGNKETG